LDGKLGSSNTVEARELIDTNDHSKIVGLAITVLAERRGRPGTSFIDRDEIDSLVNAIDATGLSANSTTQRTDYRTKGEFMISRLFSERFGGEIVAVQSGLNPPVTANFDMDDLPKLKELIAKAQSAVQSTGKQTD
jgi:hypothetical protein